MLTYNDLYEFLRKEKYSDLLQSLPKNFVIQYSEYMVEKKKQFSLIEEGNDMFADDLLREKKQFENALTLFKELMLRRKKKILNLVFVAAETGIMKKDFTDMLIFERELFEQMVKSIDESDKSMSKMLNGKPGDDGTKNKMIIMADDVDKFVDMDGNVIGPFKSGELVNLDGKVAEILVGGGEGEVG